MTDPERRCPARWSSVIASAADELFNLPPAVFDGKAVQLGTT
jgi:hypothetical protein